MKYYSSIFYILFLFTSLSGAKAQEIQGDLKTWHKVELSFNGPASSEYDTLNPFLDYRLDVKFEHIASKTSITIPGFYAADGNSAESSARSGNIWQVRFSPSLEGEWTYVASFVTGKNIAVADDASGGKTTSFDGAKGTLTISKSDKTGRDLRGKGRLVNKKNHYLKFKGSNELFIKGGANSPENLLGYYEFDQTPPKHKYAPHAKDYKEGDPTWQGGKGKNIIGALNYLSSTGTNAVYFLTMNVMGDGKDVYPWTEYHERYRFNCSKLDQWEIVFDHMDKIGLVKHVITQETENENLLDIGYVGIQRKLYYRELIARFGHHPGLVWNMGEENGITSWSPIGQTAKQRNAMITYMKNLDPYKNPVFIHTLPSLKDHENTLTPLLDNKELDGISIQIHHLQDAYVATKKWRDESAKSGNPWVMWVDEIGPAHAGTKPDEYPTQQDTVRKEVMWPNLMAGGAGFEHYFGYKVAHNDLNCEDWRSRDRIWKMTRFATDFFVKYVDFENLSPNDELIQGIEGHCLGEKGKSYVVYIKRGESGQIDLGEAGGTFNVSWFNPRTGGALKKGKRIKGNGWVSIGNAPAADGEDWAVLIKKK
ncbi:MAG: DUF5060 domain-containing protein [Reichenbachiella sp.]